jgi:hypothetical protein
MLASSILHACVFLVSFGIIKHNFTFIACGFRKYENLFTHEYHIALGRALREYDTLGWINFHSSLTRMQ